MELIKITESNGKKVVSARELHILLVSEAKGGQIGEDFSNWIKRNIDYLDAKVNVDYVTIEFDYLGNRIDKNSESNNQAVRVHRREYALSIDLAKQISMIQNNDKGKQARTYFIECEKQLQLQAPRTLKEALILAVKLEEEKEQLQLQLEEQAPKVAVFERVLDGMNTYTLDTVSDTLNIGRTTISTKLKEINWAVKDSSKGTSSTRYAEECGFAKTVFEYVTIGGKDYKQKKIVLTKKGLDALIKKLDIIY